MAIELTKKQIQLNEMAEQEMVQVVKERDLIVPDGKPDMQRVMYVDGTVNIDQMDIQEGRVVYKGQIDLTVIYTPENNPTAVCKMKGSIPIEDFIIVDGVDEDKKVNMSYEIENIYTNIINERKLNVKAILKVVLDMIEMKDIQVVTEATGDHMTLTQTKDMEVIKPMASGVETYIIKDELTIPQGKASIDEVLKVNTTIKDEQIKRVDDQMVCSGMVEVSMVYKGHEEDKIEVAKYMIPIHYPIELAQSEDEMYWTCEMSVEPTYAQVNPDYDGEDRILEMEGMVKIAYATYDKMKETIVDDIYCPGKKVQLDENMQKFMNIAGKTEVKLPKKEIITVEKPIDDMAIFNVEMKPTIESQEMQGDKLTVGGIIETKTTYVDPENPSQLETAENVVSFTDQIQVPGMKEDSIVKVEVTPKNINMANYNQNDMMLEYVMDYVADAYIKDEVKVIEDVEVTDMMPEEMNQFPSITVYVVKKGDSLWKLAKHYNTTVQDIMEINDIDNNGVIYPGQKIIILKKNKY